ncbi:DUF2147 domain-containing protein [Stappia taiwanensis]|uniref:DUF2147 domain-containing protein n=1 Tax=Stappia taiwanensis TaxID=992267 RepID=A0A838XKP6_9HYPH|nr:DUF2147 domain-containing protein [Stappia taiwanensis]MBA4610712.1 DUF2147 domain-containing protein [Stappia taiwanensis]GGE82731.1 hypothetical protein GCM10007285_07860 [Stappia taiwanensis]
MKITVAGLAAGLTLMLTLPAQAADARGEWARPSGSSRIKIASCGGALCGTLVWLKSPRKDVKNPDPAKRSRPLVGSRTVLGMKPSGKAGQWKGKVYNAEDGKTYTGFMTMDGNNKLKLEGCVLGGLICKGETWSRVR